MAENRERQVITYTKFARLYRDGEFAVKVLSKDLCVPPHNVQKERQILKKLKEKGDCMHIIKLIDEKMLADEIELIFTYYPFDLHQYMESCYLRPQKKNNPYYNLGNSNTSGNDVNDFDNNFNVNRFARDFMLQISTGLKFIHENGIIHRDIKPRNIMLQPSDSGFKLVIIDFGISYDITQVNSDEPADSKITDVSTSIYKAPELLFGVKSYSSAIDIWAFMVIISQWFTRKSDTKNYLKSCFDDGFRPGDMDGSDIKLIFSIFENLGVPSIDQWPELKNHGSYEVFEGFFGNSDTSNYIVNLDNEKKLKVIRKLFERIDELEDKQFQTQLISCLIGMCVYESTERITAAEIIDLIS